MLLLPVYSSEPGSHPQAPTLQALLWKRSEKVACGRSERELSVENYANKSERKLSLEKKKSIWKRMSTYMCFLVGVIVVTCHGKQEASTKARCKVFLLCAVRVASTCVCVSVCMCQCWCVLWAIAFSIFE